MLPLVSPRLLVVVAAVALNYGMVFVLSALGQRSTPAGPPAEEISAPDPAASAPLPAVTAAGDAPAPIIEQSYVGTNQCFGCHRPQANSWSQTDHAHALTHLPEKYRTDPACLACHVTGFGAERGYVAGNAKDLLMVGCESCHGPGARHIDAAQRFVLSTPADEARIEKEMRETITHVPRDSVCTGCHTMQSHHNHPAYDGAPSPQVAGGAAVSRTPAGAVVRRSTSLAGPVRYSSMYNIKTCGSCHYGEYMQWRAEAHSALSGMLPAQYGNNPDCQTCHPASDPATGRFTGHAAPHPNQIGVTCESCHGLALQHVRFNVQFISGPALGPRLEQAARDSITQGKPANSCIQCHVRQSHRPHPPFEN